MTKLFKKKNKENALQVAVEPGVTLIYKPLQYFICLDSIEKILLSLLLAISYLLFI